MAPSEQNIVARYILIKPVEVPFIICSRKPYDVRADLVGELIAVIKKQHYAIIFNWFEKGYFILLAERTKGAN
jgi:hypothetical protein